MLPIAYPSNSAPGHSIYPCALLGKASAPGGFNCLGLVVRLGLTGHILYILILKGQQRNDNDAYPFSRR
jgi:hypothetical protein